MRRFRGIIIAQWVLLIGFACLETYNLNDYLSGIIILFITAVTLVPPLGDGFIISNIGLAIIGMTASGLGTSVYTSKNMNSQDWLLKKALLNVTVR